MITQLHPRAFKKLKANQSEGYMDGYHMPRSRVFLHESVNHTCGKVRRYWMCRLNAHSIITYCTLSIDMENQDEWHSLLS